MASRGAGWRVAIGDGLQALALWRQHGHTIAAPPPLTRGFALPVAAIPTCPDANAVPSERGFTTFDNPLCPGDPNAILIATYNENKRTGIFNLTDRRFFVVDDCNGHWTLYHSDRSYFQTGNADNILVIKP